MAIIPDAQVDAALSATQWRRDDKEIVRTVQRGDFAEALAFVNAVGGIAEEANHHPDIDIRWNTVTLRLSTHSEGGITEADLALAQEIDEVA
ncbi:MAG: 4a-hydroxytetrahydrobiopterin dehydratase [Acidimicrobiales bacterium]